MTRRTNAKIAGFTYLLYIAVAFPSMVLFDRATGGEGIPARLASIAQHVFDLRVCVVLTLLSSFSALVLAVALYGITRDEDRELAVLALTCRVCEGLLVALSLEPMLGLLWLATVGAGAGAPDVAAANALSAFLLMPGKPIAATFFAVGSTLFSWLLLRGRMVPVPLAWLGVFASILLVVLLPANFVGWVGGPVTNFMWLPMLVFEVVLALWLLIKGVAPPPARGA